MSKYLNNTAAILNEFEGANIPVTADREQVGERTEWFTGQPEEGVCGLGDVRSRRHAGHAGNAIIHVRSNLMLQFAKMLPKFC